MLHNKRYSSILSIEDFPSYCYDFGRTSRDHMLMWVTRVPPIRFSPEDCAHNREKELHAQMRVTGVETPLVIQVAPAHQLVVVRLSFETITQIAVGTKMMQIIIALEHFMVFQHPNALGAQIWLEKCRCRRAVVFGHQSFRHIVKQRHDDDVVALVPSISARGGLQPMLPQINQGPDAFASLIL